MKIKLLNHFYTAFSVLTCMIFFAPTANALLKQPVFDVKDYGAIGDGTTNDRQAIQASIDACENTGGTVYLHNGIFRSGMITLKSNMTFYIDTTATLFGVGDTATVNIDYPKQDPDTYNLNKNACKRGFVYSNNAHNLTITGGGTINGNGKYAPWNGYGLDETHRPIPIWLVQSKNVELSNIKVVDGAMWDIVPFETDSLVIRNVDISSNIVANRDGIDIVDCHHVLIENCNFYTDDDVICPKSGHIRGVRDVIVRNCTIKKSGRANGIKFGTMGYGSFKNMLFEDITMEDVNLAGIALEAVDGADIDSIVFRRITMDNVGVPFFILIGDRGNTPAGGTHKIGSISNITFEDITAGNLKTTVGCPISGLKKNGITYKVKNISFENVFVDFQGGLATAPSSPGEYTGQYPEVNMWGNLPSYGFFIRHADGVSFKNCNFSACPVDARPLMVCSDTTNIVLENATETKCKIINVATVDTHTGDSGFLDIDNLWNGSTANAANDTKATGNVEAWVEFDLKEKYKLTQAKLWEDNSGSQITQWKVMYWDNDSWKDIFPYVESNTYGWQIHTFNLTADKIRMYAKCNTGSSANRVSIHEFGCFGEPIGLAGLNNAIKLNQKIYATVSDNNLQVSGLEESGIATIFNLSGSVVMKTIIDVQKPTISISGLAKSIYLLKINNPAKQEYVCKFVN